MTRAALVQFNASDNPQENLETLIGYLAKAIQDGAEFILTPEVTNCVSASRSHQNEVLSLPNEDIFLKEIPKIASDAGVWILLGSLALKTTDADGRFANRSVLLDGSGVVRATYEKIHMFDVQISEQETYRERDGYHR